MQWPKVTVVRVNCLPGIMFFPFIQFARRLPPVLFCFVLVLRHWGSWHLSQWMKWHHTLGSHSRQMLVVRHKSIKGASLWQVKTVWEWGHLCSAGWSQSRLRGWTELSTRKETMSPDFVLIHAWDFKRQNWNVLEDQGHGATPTNKRASVALHSFLRPSF